jgi:hypothetical protein
MTNPKIKFIVTPPPDADVENSDASYTDTVASGGTLVVPDINIEVNTVVEGSIPAIKDVKILITDGVNPVTPDDVSVAGDTVTVEVPSGGGSFDVDLVDRFGNAFPTKQVTANATWDLRTLTPFDFADLYLSRESDWGVSGAYTDLEARAAITQLVVDLHASGVWQKLYFLHPFVGGTASKHSWNLKYPFDAPNAMKMDFIGSPTHSGLGVETTNTSAGSISFNPQFVKKGYEFHFGIYSQGGTLGQLFPTDMGYNVALNSGFYVSIIYNSDANHRAGIFGIFGAPAYTGSDAGFFVGNRLGTNFRSARNDVNIVSGTSSSNGTFTPAINTAITLGAANSNGGSIINGANRTYSAFSIGDGLTDAEITSYNTAMHTFNAALGRAQL